MTKPDTPKASGGRWRFWTAKDRTGPLREAVARGWPSADTGEPSMTLIERAAKGAVRDYGLANKRTRGNMVRAIRAVMTICGVDVRTAKRALEAAQEKEQS